MLSKGLTRVSLVALVAAMLVLVPIADSARAQTASGQTSFSIAIPKIVILHYFANIGVTLSETILLDHLNGSATTTDLVSEGDSTGISVTAGANGADLAANAAISASALDGSLTVTLHIDNAWAVRAMAAGTDNVTMTFTAPTTLTGSGTETIAVSGAVIGEGSDYSTYSASNPHSPGGLGSPTTGGVGMDLNLSSITEADSFSGTWTITATIT